MNEAEMERFACVLAEKLESARGPCRLSPGEQDELKNLLKTKKSSVRLFFWVVGALAVWILKDVYTWIVSHLALK